MAADEFVLTDNPQRTVDLVRADRVQYDRVRDKILENLHAHGPMAVEQLADLVDRQLQADFDGSLRWYFNMVRADLEACGALGRVTSSNSQQIDIA